MTQQTIVIQQSPATSGLAIAGLIFSALGWITCGFLCLIGVPLCFLALFSKGPKGAAIAGLIVGFPGVLFFAFAGAAMIAGMLGLGAAASVAIDEASKELERQKTEAKYDPVPSFPTAPIDEPEASEVVTEEPKIEAPVDPIPEPKPIEPEIEIAEEPTPEPPKQEEFELRTWSDASGKFKTEARYKSIAFGKVTLIKADGKEVTVPIEKLSGDDQLYLTKIRNR